MCSISVIRMASLRIRRGMFVMDARRAFFSNKNKKTDVGNAMAINEPRAFENVIKPSPMKPVETQVTSGDKIYENLMSFSVCGSVIVLLAYIIYIKQPSELRDIFNVPPEEFVALVDRDLLRRQIRYRKAAGKDVTLMEAELALMNSQIAEIRSRPKESAS